MEPVTNRILEFNKDRNADILALKYQRMQESPFRFFRGSCHLFYEDLANENPFGDDTKAWICGDLHLENFGSFKGGNGLVYFDINDFDEAILAPVSWEIVRTVTSIYLAVKTLGVDLKTADKLAERFFTVYQRIILRGKPAAFERNTTTGLVRKFITMVAKRKSREMLSERMRTEKGQVFLRIIKEKTIRIKDKQKKARIKLLVNHWCKKHNNKQWKICDIAYRIAGTGSLGIDRFVILMRDTLQEKYFLLDMKNAKSGSITPFLQTEQPVWKNEAERIVTLQDYLQNVSPSILDTIVDGNESYVIKKLQPQADAMNLDLCKGKIKKLEQAIDVFAEITASAHLRASGRLGSSTIDTLISFFSTSAVWEKTLISYSKSYAVQVQRDYESFCKDYK